MTYRLCMLPVLAALTLSGCGEDQTAQTSGETNTAQAPATTSTTAPATSSTSTAGAGATTATAPASSQAAAPSAGTSSAAPTTTGAVGNPVQQIVGKSYSAGPVTLRLDPNGTFEMRESAGNRRVEGKYAVQNGIVTFSDPQGDVGGASFPMRCRFEGTVREFKLGDVESSCVRLKDLSFKPAA